MVEDQKKSDQGFCFLSAPPAFEAMVDTDVAREQLRSCLRNGWKRFADLRFREVECLSPGWDPARLLAFCGENDMILMAVFTVEAEGGTQWMEAIYPLTTLRRHAGLFQE
jgi:hypothetical protein